MIELARSDRGAVLLSPNALRVLERRYLQRDAEGNVAETPEQMFRRVARNIAGIEESEEARRLWEKAFFGVMSELLFLPNSPTLMNAGTEMQQLAACFVLPVRDSMESIFDAIKNTALIHKSGGGTGFSFSQLRPKEDIVKTTHGVSSGPVSFLRVFDSATEAVKQGGRRRGANMAILRVDHPDILEFIDSKTEGGRLENFNLSVALTDTFMQALTADSDYDLVNPRTGTASQRLGARAVFDKIVRAAWHSGEPGIVFIDRINADNPTPSVGPIESTNPCGEQPLLPFESCNLGSINLGRMVRRVGETTKIDYERIGDVVEVAVRFLDNVIDASRYPIAEIEALTVANRKIGLGVMGFADMLSELEVPYDSEEAEEIAEQVMGFVAGRARRASQQLAAERGPFPNFPDSVYAQRGDRPLRNATTTTIAPTGSISILAQASSGVEPLFAVAYTRNVLGGEKLVEVNPVFERVARREGFYSDKLMERIAAEGRLENIAEIPQRWRRLFRTAHDVEPEAHVRIQAAFQKHTDNAVSKTVNLPREATPGDVEQVLTLAYGLGCKGVTVYRDGSRDAQVLSTGPQPEEKPQKGVPQRRPDAVVGVTRKVTTGCGSLYVTVNERDGRPFELFAQMGKAGGCAASQTEAIGRLASLALRSGVDPGMVVKQLRGIRCSAPILNGGHPVRSCADAISQALGNVVDDASESIATVTAESESFAGRLAGQCAECGQRLEFEGGCVVCRDCGFSRCG